MLRLLLVCCASLGLLISGCSAPPGNCSAATCNGCCDATGACQPGDQPTACGSAGATCASCAGGTACVTNVCTMGSTGGGAGGGTGTGGGTGGSTMAGSFTVSGRATYDFVPIAYDPATDTGRLDFANAAPRPVRNAVIRVLEGTTVLATTNTAADGAYSLPFTSTGAAPLTVQLLAKTSAPAVTVQDNTAGYVTWAIARGVPQGGGTLDVHATSGWTGTRYGGSRQAGPFAILDSMYTAASAFLAARPALQFPELKVNWSPNNTTATNGTVEQGFIGGSYYDPDLNQIFVVGKDGVDTDEYDAHVIVHEWGHYFEANLARSDSLGGDHSAGDVLDPRDAFSEGWGDAASGILLDDPLYADTYWEAGALVAFGWDLENEPAISDDPTPGVFSEVSVMRLLYDAWDSSSDGAFDQLEGLGAISDAFRALRTTDALCTIASFANAYKTSAPASATAFDTLAARYGVGAITTDFGDGDTRLRPKYVNVSALPFSANASLDGRVAYNFAGQNKYYVFTGNGQQVTIKATSAQDVGITAYQRGTWAGFADDLDTGGTEEFSFASTAGAIYVLNLTGYGANNQSYSASVSITSP